MGCDIHFNVERYNARLRKWIYVKGPTRPCWVCDSKPNPACWHCGGTGKAREEFYEGRNYNLFAMLADVRNDETIKPLSSPRDLPDDVSREVKRKSDKWGEDGHSHSWFLLSELLDDSYWDREVNHTGLVELFAYETWKVRGAMWPEEWCKGTSGKIIEEDEAKKLLADRATSAAGRLDPPQRMTHVRCTWKTTYRESVKHFVDETLPELRKLAKDPKHIRVVFWFDN